MRRKVGDTSSNLGAATDELTDLRSRVTSLRQELDRANSELNSSNSQVTENQVRKGQIAVNIYPMSLGKHVSQKRFW